MVILANHDECTGCGSCYNACSREAIQMREDSEGFLFPYIVSDKCIECCMCSKSCPILTDPRCDSSVRSFPLVYAMWSNRDRQISSSGGAFSAIARYVLDRNGVVFGAILDSQLKCQHKRATTIEELQPIRGSKYIQSDVGYSFQEIKKYLSNNVLVLFSGTPCQVAGLKSFLKKDFKNLIVIDLVCHGVPSNAIFNSYIEKLKKKRPDFVGIDGFEFRRFDGWGYAPSVNRGGEFLEVFGVDNLYMEAFEKSAIFRKSCYHCRYAKIPRIGDITIADFWGIGKHGKTFKHITSKGVSLLLANNERGQKIVSKLQDCYLEERSLEEALAENPNICYSTPTNDIRNEVISAFLDTKTGLNDIEKEFLLVNRSLKGRIKRGASRYGVFNGLKKIYDIFRSL